MRSIEQAFEVQRVAGRRSSAGVRLTRRGRAVVVLAMLVVLIAAGFTLGRGSSQAAGPAAHRPLPTVTVAPGETLWQIAARVDPSADRRALVDQIEALNHLHGGRIVAGQQLKLPRR